MNSSKIPSAKASLRGLPAVDKLILALPAAVEKFGAAAVSDCARHVLQALRNDILAGESEAIAQEVIEQRIVSRLEAISQATLRPVFNLTGTVLHTNLGRAVMPAVAMDAIVAAATQYTNLEFDLDTGKRGDRESHVEGLICELTGAEAATVVNNNAAAVLLVLNTLAFNREVPVSRGELVEIGGSFRIPEVMQRANCTLVEVGATNRTHLEDYRSVINDSTALLMKVHTSNYRVEGFTKEVTEAELSELAAEFDLPLVLDLGSGSLVDFAKLGLPAEPTAAKTLSRGADLITFSGDKLLGGPQSGFIAGRKDLVEQVKKNPLKRALRLDKMTLAGIAEVLRLYRDPDTLTEKLPTLKYLTRPQADIHVQCSRLAPLLSSALGEQFSVEVIESTSQIGSGSLPVETIPSAAIRIAPAQGQDDSLQALAIDLRALPIPVIGRIHRGALLLDLRCLEDESAFGAQLDSLRL